MTVTVEGVASVVTAAAALAAVCLAWSGLRTWRKELVGRTEYEVAKQTLLAVHRVRNAMRVIRSHLPPNKLWSNDGKSEAPEASVYHHLWRRLDEALAQFSTELLEAGVLWPSLLDTPAKSLNICVVRLTSARWQHYRCQEDDEYRARVSDQLDTMNNIIHWFGPDTEPDPFGDEIRSAVEGFESVLRPHLGHKRAAS